MSGSTLDVLVEELESKRDQSFLVVCRERRGSGDYSDCEPPSDREKLWPFHRLSGVKLDRENSYDGRNHLYFGMIGEGRCDVQRQVVIPTKGDIFMHYLRPRPGTDFEERVERGELRLQYSSGPVRFSDGSFGWCKVEPFDAPDAYYEWCYLAFLGNESVESRLSLFELSRVRQP